MRSVPCAGAQKETQSGEGFFPNNREVVVQPLLPAFLIVFFVLVAVAFPCLRAGLRRKSPHSPGCLHERWQAAGPKPP